MVKTKLAVALEDVDKQINKLNDRRLRLLKRFRLACKHLRIAELGYRDWGDGSPADPPKRICMDCGAEERGWNCGYHVLAVNGDTWAAHHKSKRIITSVKTDSEFYGYRRGEIYGVGQSHPCFKKGGPKTYAQLTAIP